MHSRRADPPGSTPGRQEDALRRREAARHASTWHLGDLSRVGRDRRVTLVPTVLCLWCVTFLSFLVGGGARIMPTEHATQYSQCVPICRTAHHHACACLPVPLGPARVGLVRWPSRRAPPLQSRIYSDLKSARVRPSHIVNNTRLAPHSRATDSAEEATAATLVATAAGCPSSWPPSWSPRLRGHASGHASGLVLVKEPGVHTRQASTRQLDCRRPCAYDLRAIPRRLQP